MARSVLAPVPQRVSYDGERQVVPGNLVRIKERDLKAFRPGFEATADQLAPEEHVYLIDVREIEDRVQGFDFYICPRLFPRFPRGSLGRGLVVFHEARGQGPVAAPRLDGAAREQNASPSGDKAAGDDLGIRVVNRTAAFAHVPLAIVEFGNAAHKRCGALRTKAHGCLLGSAS